MLFFESILHYIAKRRSVEFCCAERADMIWIFHGVDADLNSFYVQVVNAGRDGAVNSEIKNRKPALKEKGFSLILGIRDFPPKGQGTWQEIQKVWHRQIPKGEPSTHVAIACRAIEAWFLGDRSHLDRRFPACHSQMIEHHYKHYVGGNPPEAIPDPVGAIRGIYRALGEEYVKSKAELAGVINCLDLDFMCNGMRQTVPSLSDLCDRVEWFMELG